MLIHYLGITPLKYSIKHNFISPSNICPLRDFPVWKLLNFTERNCHVLHVNNISTKHLSCPESRGLNFPPFVENRARLKNARFCLQTSAYHIHTWICIRNRMARHIHIYACTSYIYICQPTTEARPECSFNLLILTAVKQTLYRDD